MKRATQKTVPWGLGVAVVNKCNVCGKKYSRSEVIRIYGNMWWTPLYCSAQCYTKAQMKGE